MVSIDIDTDGLADVYGELDDLRDDWGDDGVAWTVGSAVGYGVYLEFGTSDMDPKPFFRPVVSEVRARGAVDFLEAHTDLDVAAVESTKQLVSAFAFAIERRVKEIITRKGLVDTGTLRASVLAVPLAAADDLPTAEEFSGFDAENPAPVGAGRALLSTDIEIET
jgi:hypothetical protein